MIRFFVTHPKIRTKLGVLASDRLWSLEAVLMPPSGTGNYERHWLVNRTDGTIMRLVVDPILPTPFVVIEGPSEVATFQIVSNAFGVRSVEELLSEHAAASSPEESAHAALRLGVAAPSAFRQDIFDAVARSLADPDARVRCAALWAAAYSPWIAWRPVAAR